jgi:hypothetical protein
MTKARGDLPDTSADLSEAARAVVRDAGDPRTDAYLAALGLVDSPAPPAVPVAAEPAPATAAAEPAPATAAAPVETPVAVIAAEQLALPVAPSVDPDLATLRARVAGLEADLAAAASRVRVLGVALAIATVGVVVLAALLVSRPA